MHRFNALFVEVLTVALIVPNAVYPGAYDHPYLVFGADLLATTTALGLKWALHRAGGWRLLGPGQVCAHQRAHRS